MASKFMERAASRDYSKRWALKDSYPWMAQMGGPKITGRPYSVKENYVRAVKGNEPYWIPAYGLEADTIWPDAIEEHPVPEVDGLDWFGVDWVWVEVAGGMMPRPGTRTLSDFANWKEEIQWPDLSVVDFEADGKKIAAWLDPDKAHVFQTTEGIFERLHELIPFDETLIAFYEEPELLEEYMQRCADYKIDLVDIVRKYYGRVDGVLYNDDWGTERSGFFSNEMFREQMMPATSRLIKHIKDAGMFMELHSCGRNMQYVPMMIEMGIDMWSPQQRCNDYDWLYENYGDKMTFNFMVTLPEGADEAETRRVVRDFVDHYGEKGRIVAWLMTMDPKQREAGLDELYNYSLEYYNKKYHR